MNGLGPLYPFWSGVGIWGYTPIFSVLVSTLCVFYRQLLYAYLSQDVMT